MNPFEAQPLAPRPFRHSDRRPRHHGSNRAGSVFGATLGLLSLFLAGQLGCTGMVGPGDSPGSSPDTGNGNTGTGSGTGSGNGQTNGTGSTSGAGTGGSTGTGAGPVVVGGTGGMGEVVPTQPACDGTVKPGKSYIRRLNGGEYDATVRDLVGATKVYSTAFPPDEQGATGGFSNNAASLVVGELLAEAYQKTAEELATAALTSLDKLAPACNRTSMGDAACAKSFIEGFGKRAFRRPLAADEVTRYQAIYTTGAMGATFNDGVSLVIEAMLQSPHFLYRVEIGEAPAANATYTPLTQYEIATRLSYFLWRSTPDPMLLSAADAKQLSTPEQMKTQIDRLLQDNRAHQMVQAFHREWLHLNRTLSATKVIDHYPMWKPEFQADLMREADALVEEVFWKDGKLSTLLTAPYSFLNASLAPIYGVKNVTGTALVKTNLDTTQRAGILTTGAFLAGHAGADQSSPILRGKFVREYLLCQHVDEPPANLTIKVPDVIPGTTTRQRFEEHDKIIACAGCHAAMDPLGYPFESYDAIGQWRTTDQGIMVDTSGEITGADPATNAKVTGAVDMLTKLSTSPMVANCLSTMWFRWGMGRNEDTKSATKEDACSIETIQKQFQTSGYDMRTLPLAVASTDAFRYRKVGGAQ